MCECDVDPPRVYHESTRTARKPHRCCECRSTITPGEQYEHVFGVWDGQAASQKTCAQCVLLRSEAMRFASCFCFTFGNVISEIRDELIDSGELRATEADRRRQAWKLAREYVRARRRLRHAIAERKALRAAA